MGLPYITYSRSHDSGRLFRECKRVEHSLRRAGEAAIVVRRGNKTISDIVTDSMKHGFDSVSILDFRDRSRREVVTRRIRIDCATRGYSWDEPGAASRNPTAPQM